MAMCAISRHCLLLASFPLCSRKGFPIFPLLVVQNITCGVPIYKRVSVGSEEERWMLYVPGVLTDQPPGAIPKDGPMTGRLFPQTSSETEAQGFPVQSGK